MIVLPGPVLVDVAGLEVLVQASERAVVRGHGGRLASHVRARIGRARNEPGGCRTIGDPHGRLLTIRAGLRLLAQPPSRSSRALASAPPARHRGRRVGRGDRDRGGHRDRQRPLRRRRPPVAGRDHPHPERHRARRRARRPPPLSKLPCRANLTSTEPLKLWVGGDSLAGSLGPALGTLTGATGVVQPYFHSRVSSGLSNPSFVDWPALGDEGDDRGHARGRRLHHQHQRLPRRAEQDRRRDRRAGVEGRVHEGSRRHDEGARGRRGAPCSGSARRCSATPSRTTRSRSSTRSRRTSRRSTRTSCTSTRTRCSPIPTASTPPPSPTPTARRSSPAPATACTSPSTAATISLVRCYKVIDAQCRITAQAVTGVTKQTIQTPGSTQVAPGSGGSGGSVGTTPPATGQQHRDVVTVDGNHLATGHDATRDHERARHRPHRRHRRRRP